MDYTLFNVLTLSERIETLSMQLKGDLSAVALPNIL